jgi:hypothetical protein
MRKRPLTLYLVLALSLFVSACKTRCISIPPDELEEIGRLIFINEGAGKVENLTVWNEGEEFASLGIGHFLWYPRGKEYRFTESFPALFEFIKSEGVQPPEWMNELRPFDLPWNTRGEFYRDFNSQKMVSLREFLLDTISLQSLFIANRLEDSLPMMLEAAPESSRKNIKKQFYRVANSYMGMYVLMDYVNFKGEGIKESERYNGEGWGLLQVLENMSGDEEGLSALREFAQSAGTVLERRAKNSPPERNEARWLPGWRKRIETYVPRNVAAYDSSSVENELDGTAEILIELYRNFVCKYL